MIEQGYEGEVSVVVISDDEGNEMYYAEEVTIPYNGKTFAVLVSLPPEDEEDNHNDEPEVIIARIDMEDGEEVYVAPEEDEFEAVIKLYEEMD